MSEIEFNHQMKHRVAELEAEVDKFKMANKRNTAMVQELEDSESRLKAEVTRLRGASGACLQCEQRSREVARLRDVLQWARDRVGSMPFLDGLMGQFARRMEEVGITFPRTQEGSNHE